MIDWVRWTQKPRWYQVAKCVSLQQTYRSYPSSGGSSSAPSPPFLCFFVSFSTSDMGEMLQSIRSDCWGKCTKARITSVDVATGELFADLRGNLPPRRYMYFFLFEEQTCSSWSTRIVGCGEGRTDPLTTSILSDRSDEPRLNVIRIAEFLYFWL
jgi:hypothetical protein